MKSDGWRYYNHALIPTCAPHESPDLTPIENGEIWRYDLWKSTPFLARWTEDFDCKQYTNWWYIIKDTPFDLGSLKAKRRYEINKVIKNFEVRQLRNAVDYAEELCDVQMDAFSAYPLKYRPNVDRAAFIKSVNTWDESNCRVYGAFSREDDRLCGYALLKEDKTVVNFNVLKTRPESEKYAVNAAIVYRILQDYNEKLARGYYICDGARSVVHETFFQDYLEKYFAFRKAYCKLRIVYNPRFERVILFLYRFRKVFMKLDCIGLAHRMNGVFEMQEIIESQG